jgi:hypothetical protein
MTMADSISLTCPHCKSELSIDMAAGVVVGHTPPVIHRDKTDFDTRLKELEDEKKRAADRLNEAIRMEKSKERIMEDRFKKLMDDAKDFDPDERPLRDIDLD